jgi:hypothetical protein
MSIPADQHPSVRAIDVNAYETELRYGDWEEHFGRTQNTFLQNQIAIIRNSLGSPVTRETLTAFYRDAGTARETHFIAAMIWGYAAPAGSKPAGYGPYRLCKMFSNPIAAAGAINAVAIGTDADIGASYALLNRTLELCGPNFFTKHFYFLGKSLFREENRLLIFDDRVARGIVRLTSSNPASLNMVRVGAIRTPRAYIRYLDYAYTQATAIGCATDQVEYYLFTR